VGNAYSNTDTSTNANTYIHAYGRLTGGTITYTVTISAWGGFVSPIDVSLTVTGLGYSETYTLPTQYPPYPKTYTIPIDIPSGTPPGTYTGTITATGGGIKRTDSTTLELPGFEAVFAIVGLLAVAYLLRRRR
ncbi:MAG: PGF-CTERM sorting domain-containing protein, partial [Euryarchaeota archaeon]|nr:PGF-CTERM sorting domain-containing protein [Euryarchaeota archaeon]